MTSLATDSFTAADSSAWSSTWALGVNPSAGGSALIFGNAGRLTCGSAGGYSGNDRISRLVNITSPADACILLKFRFKGSEVYPRIVMRSTNTALDTQGGYHLDLNQPINQFQITKQVSYTGTTLGSPVSYTYTNNTWYWLRYGVIGTVIRARVWADGSSEPTGWDIDITDSAISAAGPVGITVGGGNTASGTFEIDELALDTIFPPIVGAVTGASTGASTLTAGRSDSRTITAATTAASTITAGASNTVTVTGAASTASSTITGGTGAATYKPLEDAGYDPSALAGNSDSALTVGLEFFSSSGGTVTEIRWFQPSSGADGSSTRQGAIWSVDVGTEVPTLVGTATSAAPSGTGWQTLTFSSPVTIATSTTYRVGVLHPAGGYVATANYFTSGPGSTAITDGPLTLPNATNAIGSHQGSFHYSASLSFPDGSFNGGNYGVDFTFVSAGGAVGVANGQVASAGSATASRTDTGAVAGATTGASSISANTNASRAVAGQAIASSILTASQETLIFSAASGDANSTSSISAAMLITFTTPSIRVRPFKKHGLFSRLYLDRGVSILRFGTSYQRIDTPSVEQIDTADAAFIGGHTYLVGFDEAMGLQSAGYGAWLGLAPGAPIDEIDYTQYGTGAYGSGPYGD